LRSLGAGPGRIFALLLLEGTLVTATAACAGVLATALTLSVGGQWLSAHYGITVAWHWLGAQQWLILAGILVAGTLASAWPGWRAYRLSVVDGLQPRA
jgi:putative ABC transport system permease protein